MENKPNLNQNGTPVSKIDSFSGKHTTTIVVAILFFLTLSALLILICVKDEPKDTVITGLIGLLSALVGFFAGNATRADN